MSLSERTDAFGLPVAAVRHEYTAADVRRRDALVRAARRILRRAGGLVGKVRLIDSFSHAVGTARFARTPEEGALSPECRVWALPNLFVVDGSFMPTSGGVNPSLTITANAFRVAAHMRREFGAIAASLAAPHPSLSAALRGRGDRRSDRDRAWGFGAVARGGAVGGIHVGEVGEDVLEGELRWCGPPRSAPRKSRHMPENPAASRIEGQSKRRLVGP